MKFTRKLNCISNKEDVVNSAQCTRDDERDGVIATEHILFVHQI